MKLKTRLVVAFFTIIFLPLLLTVVALAAIGTYQIKSMEENYDIKSEEYGELPNTVLMLTKITNEDFLEMSQVSEDTPDKFEDSEYLKSQNDELISKYSYLVVRRNNEIVFNGGELEEGDLLMELPSYGNYESDLDNGFYIGGDVQAIVKQIDFRFEDNSEGSAFIVTTTDTIVPQVKSLFIDMSVAMIGILLFTSAMLTLWIYKGITTPLKKLKKATQHIKEGDLDFVLETNADDEIGELFKDFDEMRVRLKTSAEEKIQYDKESKELISNISHDLKTPITAIKGYVEGIMDGVADTPEKIDKYIKTIYSKANDMDRLIDELTFYSKIDTNRIPYTFHRINVCDYFNDCVDDVGINLEAENIELQYLNYADEGTLIIADAEQIKRVINNIIGNSVKYIGNKKGVISIRIKDVGDFIQVEIEDNGKGIPANDLPHIFERFYRADSSRNSLKGGSGIGLSIVNKIIEDHGGKIWATSKEGIGTCMYFVIRKYQEVPINE